MSVIMAICHRGLGKAVCALVMGMTLVGCGVSGPPPAIYVLGDRAAPTANATSEVGLPVVLVRPVGIPDCLDTTDLQERRGDEVVASRTGRWGERLSVGITRALTAALASRLPRMAIVTSPPIERPALQVVVDVEAFEPRRDGLVLLVGRWTVADSTAREVMISERTSLVEPAVAAEDGARVAAMTRVVDRLAARIAEGIAGSRVVGPRPNRR
jgi:uncharacterized protein